jgi:drug/metabolite transporter (DMT)-like permease
MISTLEPVVTVALAIMVLGETMTLHKILGGMMIFAAVLFLTRREAGSKIS